MKYTKVFVFVFIFGVVLSSCSNQSRRPLEMQGHEMLINVTAARSFSIDYFRMLYTIKNQFSSLKDPQMEKKPIVSYYKNLDVNQLYAKYKKSLRDQTNREETYSFAYKLSDYPAWKTYEHRRGLYLNLSKDELLKSFNKADQKAYKKELAYAKRIMDLELSFSVTEEFSKSIIGQIPDYETRKFMEINFDSIMKVSRDISLPYYFLVIKNLKEEDIKKIIDIYESADFSLYRKALSDTIIIDLKEHINKEKNSEV